VFFTVLNWFLTNKNLCKIKLISKVDMFLRRLNIAGKRKALHIEELHS
jgi:hypothetical protein